jgi:hypothetical protein
MRICASYLKPRPSQCTIFLSAALCNPPISHHCIFSSRPYRLPLSLPARTLSRQSVPPSEFKSPGWDALRPLEQVEKAQDGKKASSGVEGGEATDDRNFWPPKAELQNPESWILLLERFLPAQSTQSPVRPNSRPVGPNKSCEDILVILDRASSKANARTNLLAYLGLRQGRWQAALDLTNVLLQNVAAKAPTEFAKLHLPGLSWPRSPSLDELCSAPIHIDRTGSSTKEDTTVWDQQTLDPRYLETMSKNQDRTMTHIWKSLGYTIIEAADLAREEADAAMRFVYRVIAQIHKLGLVPDNVYAYVPSNHSSSVIRPPIIHLLSSRILTTLSDAVWRAHQDDVIAEAVRSGVGYKDLGHDPPGGRFRLKVRPLGPQVWLEFVLWCCVDGGCAWAGTKIVEYLRQRVDKPWFAVNWMLRTANSPTASIVQSATVDWDRVQLRTGGIVGRIEGYSTEQPFAVMESRTVSTEVVLALVDSLSNSLNVGIAHRGSSLRKVQSSITSLLTFLEPHRIPLGYFDHLAVRLHQSGSCDPDRKPEYVQCLAEAFRYMRSLESAENPVTASVSFELQAITRHSELLNGLFHQALEAFVSFGDIRRALDVFAEIQQLVDSSKLQSIRIFLSTARQHSQGYIASSTVTIDEDFVVSHGQLPVYKLAAFLDLVTDSRLIRLGNWLLYSEDIDGPLITQSSYATPCLSPALLRFAAVSQDHELAKRVFKASNDQPLFPSVTFFRALANTNTAFSQYGLVHKVLRRLRKAKAGGFRPENFASLAAGVLSLETLPTEGGLLVVRPQVHEARQVMNSLLEGFYSGNPAVYRDRQIALVHRQLGSLLRILECIPDTSLSEFARKWRSQFDSGNETNLFTADFNILFAAIVETKGANVGRMIWDLFCEDPRERFDRNSVRFGSNLIPDPTEDDENEWEYSHFLREKDELPTALDGYRFLPIVQIDELTPNEVDEAVKEASADDIGYKEQEEEQAAPIPDRRISFDSELDDTSTLHPRGNAKSALDPTHSSLSLASAINPVITPNLRTLRFLVRSALNERKIGQALGHDTSEQQEILEWSKQFFRAFGIRGKAIQQEIQSLGSDEDEVPEHLRPSLAEEKRLYDRARRRLGLSEPRPVNVSPMFMNGKQGYGCVRPLPMRKAFDFVPVNLDIGRDDDGKEGERDALHPGQEDD